jgi:broad specificity phosphatase PhoE
MTMLFLVRHGTHPRFGQFLAGRMNGIVLNETGRAQGRWLAARLAREQVTDVQSSPRERAWQTAHPIAARAGVTVEIEPDIDEVDAGEWTGQDFGALNMDPRWRTWNAERGTARIPGGESMSEVQARTLRRIDRLCHSGAGGGHVLVSHAEVIKIIILHFLGLPLDACSRLEIGPGSLSTVIIGGWGAKISGLNEMVGE